MESTEKYPPYLNEPESRRLEFKEMLPKGGHLAQTVIAFANGAGGKIVFGVKDSPRVIVGIVKRRFLKPKNASTTLFLIYVILLSSQRFICRLYPVKLLWWWKSFRVPTNHIT